MDNKLKILKALVDHVEAGRPGAVFMEVDKSDKDLIASAEEMPGTIILVYGRDRVRFAERERFRKEAFSG
jgi:hypothetical protein